MKRPRTTSSLVAWGLTCFAVGCASPKPASPAASHTPGAPASAMASAASAVVEAASPSTDPPAAAGRGAAPAANAARNHATSESSNDSLERTPADGVGSVSGGEAGLRKDTVRNDPPQPGREKPPVGRAEAVAAARAKVASAKEHLDKVLKGSSEYWAKHRDGECPPVGKARTCDAVKAFFREAQDVAMSTLRESEDRLEEELDASALEPLVAGRKTPIFIRVGSVSTTGGYPKAAVRAALRERFAQLLACHDAESKEGAPPHGVVALRFEFDGAGVVRDVRPEDGRPQLLPLGKCVAHDALAWRFPPNGTGKSTLVTLPIVFAPR